MNIFKLYKYAISLNEAKIRYKLTDPFVAFFISKYGSINGIIPWNKVKTQEDISAYIKTNLLPTLKSRIDPNSDNNQYLIDIDMEQELGHNMVDPNMVEQLGKYNQDPVGYKQNHLKTINENKKKRFDEWWKGLTENEPFASSPAFIYCMMLPVIEKTPSNDKRVTFVFNEETLKTIYDRILQNGITGNTFNVMKEYDNTRIKAEKEKQEKEKQEKEKKTGYQFYPDKDTEVNEETGWLMIPSKIKDPKHYIENRNMLYNYGRKSLWCTVEGGVGKDYLELGDFWLYLYHGQANVAIKFGGGAWRNPDTIDEIRGWGNNPQKIQPHWEAVLELLEAKGWDNNTVLNVDSFNVYKTLKNIKDENIKFEENITYRQEILKEISLGNFRRGNLLSKELRSQKDVKDAYEQGWLKKFREDERDAFKEVPKEFLTNPEILKYAVKGWVDYLRRDPIQASEEHIHAIIRRDPDVQSALMEAILISFAQDLSIKRLNNVPENWKKKKAMVDGFKNAWIDGFAEDPPKMEKLFEIELEQDIIRYFKNDNDVKRGRISGWGKWLETNPDDYDNVVFPNDLKNNQLILNSLKRGYANIVRDRGIIPMRAAELFPNEPFIMNALKENIIKKLQGEYVKCALQDIYDLNFVIPENFKNNEEILAVQKGALISLFEKKPFETFSKNGLINQNYYPVQLQNDQDVKSGRISGISYFVSHDPTYYDRHEDDIANFGLTEHPTILAASKLGWTRKINADINDIWNVIDLPVDHPVKKYLMQNEEFIETFAKNLARYVEFTDSDSDYLISAAFIKEMRKLPLKVRTNKIFKEAYQRYVGRLLKTSPWKYFLDSFPKAYKDEDFVLRAIGEGLINYFNKTTSKTLITGDIRSKLLAFPRKTFDNDLIIPAYINALARIIALDPILYDHQGFPNAFKNNEVILKALEPIKNKWVQFLKDSLQKGMGLDTVQKYIADAPNMPQIIKDQVLNEMGIVENIVPQEKITPVVPKKNPKKQVPKVINPGGLPQKPPVELPDEIANYSGWYKISKQINVKQK